MTKRPIKGKVDAKDGDAAPAESGETAPLDNVGRLRTHLKPGSLSLKLLGAWTGAELRTAKPTLHKAVHDHFSEKK